MKEHLIVLQVKTINTWFKNLIGNVDILKDTDIDIDSLTELVSKFSVDMMDNLWTNKFKNISLMDLGILRFPDITKPFFSVSNNFSHYFRHFNLAICISRHRNQGYTRLVSFLLKSMTIPWS